MGYALLKDELHQEPKTDYQINSAKKRADVRWGTKQKLLQSSLDSTKRLPGQYYDDETGLLYNYQRIYDPSIGRYITSDRIGLVGGSNTYGYALQNPNGFYDPNGENVYTGVINGGRTGAQIGAPADPGGVVAGGIIGAVIGGLAGYYLSEAIIGEGTASDTRTIPKPDRPSCGCTCNCRADANDNIPGNIKPGDITFVIASATANNCKQAKKDAKRAAAKKLGKQPKHTDCLCEGR